MPRIYESLIEIKVKDTPQADSCLFSWIPIAGRRATCIVQAVYQHYTAFERHGEEKHRTSPTQRGLLQSNTLSDSDINYTVHRKNVLLLLFSTTLADVD